MNFRVNYAWQSTRGNPTTAHSLQYGNENISNTYLFHFSYSHANKKDFFMGLTYATCTSMLSHLIAVYFARFPIYNNQCISQFSLIWYIYIYIEVNSEVHEVTDNVCGNLVFYVQGDKSFFACKIEKYSEEERWFSEFNLNIVYRSSREFHSHSDIFWKLHYRSAIKYKF